MNRDSNQKMYEEMQTQLRELEHRLSELKAGMEGAASHRPRGRAAAWLFAFRALAAIGCVALLITGLGAFQSLTVDPNGVVKVSALQLAGQDLSQTLSGLRQDVNSKLPLAGGTLTSDLTVNGKLNEGNSDIYFTKTDHDHSALGNQAGFAAIENTANYNGLMILGRSTSTNGTRIVRMWDRVEVGGGPKDSPQTPLDVKGEIRGKVWNSGTYTVDWNDPKKRDIAMTRSDHSVCFLTLIRGGWAGIGEQVWVEANGDGRWHLKVIQGGAGRDVMGQAVCIGAPDESW